MRKIAITDWTLAVFGPASCPEIHALRSINSYSEECKYVAKGKNCSRRPDQSCNFTGRISFCTVKRRTVSGNYPAVRLWRRRPRLSSARHGSAPCDYHEARRYHSLVFPQGVELRHSRARYPDGGAPG